MNRPLLPLLLTLWAATSWAEVHESLQWQDYPVRAAPGQPLLAVLNAASPIRDGGQIYHAYTRWHVDWRYQWLEQPDGRCAIRSVRTEVRGTITLPTGEGALAEEGAFRQYRSALKLHEEGHFALGRDAARAIDQAIASLPEMPSCTALSARANETGHRLLEETRTRERQYDTTTGHGRTQGAWLPR